MSDASWRTISETLAGGASWLEIGFAILVINAIGFAFGARYGPQPGGWYFTKLKKASLNPPGWVFPVAWTLLYAIMGLAIARVWATAPSEVRTAALALFALQLVLNYGWSYVFFGLQWFQYAVWHTLALFAATVGATVAMGAVDPLAGWLMAPYCAWVAFAAYLTIAVARLNPDWEPQ